MPTRSADMDPAASQPDDRPRPPARGGFDFGLAAVLALLVLIPVAVWYLIDAVTADGDAISDEAPPAEVRESEQPAARDGLVRRGERARLERELEAARRELARLRLERSQSPAGMWDEAIADKQQEIEELGERLAGLGGKR